MLNDVPRCHLDGFFGAVARLALVVVTAVTLAAAGLGCSQVASVPDQMDSARPTVSPLVSIEEDGLRFSYHVPTGTSELYDLRADPDARKNLVEKRPDDARRLRRRLSSLHGVGDVGELRAEFKEDIDALRALGYL